VGWSYATVDDLGTYVNGLAFRPSDWSASGRPIIRIQNLTGSEKFNFTTRAVRQEVIVRKGDILVSWSATLDVFVWSGPEAVLNQHIFKVIPSDHINDHSFLRWALKNAIEELWASEHSHGTTMKHVNRGPFLAHLAKLPPSREQTRIAEAIDSYFTRLDDAVASLERVQRNLKRYRASVLKAAVEGRLVPTEAELARAEDRDYEPASVLLERILTERRRHWEEAELAKMKAKRKAPKDDGWKAKYAEPMAPDSAQLPELPEGWCWCTVDQVASVGTGATPKRGDPRFWSNGDVPWVTSAVVNDTSVQVAAEFVTRTALAETNLSLYPPGTLLLAMYGEGKTRGRATVLGIEATTNQALAALELNGEVSDLRDWLLRFFEHNYLELRRAASGGVQPNLNLSIVRAIVIPLPPMREQDRIITEIDASLSVAEAANDAVTRSVMKAARLRQSVLKWAFDGRLVNQDPTDEPASKLLERIKSERAAEPARSPTKRPRRATSKRKSS